MVTKKCKICGKHFATKNKRRKYCCKKCQMVAREEYERKTGQICWNCQKARGGSDCVWMNGNKEVDGWKAKKSKIVNPNGVISSYRITYCPNFISG